MSKLPAVSGRAAIRALEHFGFVQDRQNGSHVIMKKEGHEFVVTVPLHGGKDLKPGTLRAIIKDAGLTAEEFVEKL